MTIRDLIYSSGDIFLPIELRKFLQKDIKGDHNKTFYISYWSLIHFFSGILFGYLINKYLMVKNSNKLVSNYYIKMLALHTAWEFWQIFIEMSNPFSLTGSSNLVDAITDTILFMSGAWIYKEIIYRKF